MNEKAKGLLQKENASADLSPQSAAFKSGKGGSGTEVGEAGKGGSAA